MTAKIYLPNQVGNIPELPGIYAWYILPRMHTQPQAYHEIFKQRELHSVIRGILQDNYEGRLTAKPYTFGTIQDHSLLVEAVSQFAPPVYIGISINLQKRIQTHVKMLNEFVYSRQRDEISDVSDTDVDSEKESKYFAQRIGSIVRDSKDSIDINSFVIKIIKLDKNYSKSKLFEVEKFLNRTFIPYYGRR
jgi:hypothetical protein